MSILKAILSFIMSIFSYIFSWVRGGATTAAKTAEPAGKSWVMAILGYFGQGFKQCVDHPVTFVIVASAFIGGWFVGFDMASRAARTVETELSASKALNKALQGRLAVAAAARPVAPVVAPAPLLGFVPTVPAPLPAPVVVTPLEPPAVVAPAPVAAKKAHHAKKDTASTWDPVTWNWHKYWSTTNKQ